MEGLLGLATVREPDLSVVNGVQAERVGEGRAEAVGQRADARGIGHATTLPDGVGDLPHAIGRLAARRDPVREVVGRQTGDAGTGVAGHRTMLLPTIAGRPRR